MTPHDEMADAAALGEPDPEGLYLTKDDDVFFYGGQPFGTIVYARVGDDEIHGAIYLGGVHAAQGDDTIYADFERFDKGGAGDDLIFGSAGHSTVQSDHLYGGAGDDHIVQRNASSYIWGGSGDDTIELGFFASVVKAGSGDDVVSYWSAAQIGGKSLDLGSGDDVVDGSASFSGQAPVGTVFTDGRGGDDRVIAGVGADVFHGGHGVDGIDYSFETAAVTVDLKTGVNGGAAAADILEGVENVTGTAFDDSLTGNGRANVLVGGAGADTIRGGGGDDWIYAGAGADVLKGGAGADVFFCDVFDTIVDFNPDEGDVRINVPTVQMTWDRPDHAAPDESRHAEAAACHGEALL